MADVHADPRDVRRVRAARNQALFRTVNEQLEALNQAFERLEPLGDWVCECADERCIERLRMTVDEYESVRRRSDRFPVLPGHEVPEVERIVETHERFIVVEKLGAAGDMAAALDQRRPESA